MRTGLWIVTRSHVGGSLYDISCTVVECSCRGPFNGPTSVFPYKDFDGTFIKKNRLICKDSIQTTLDYTRLYKNPLSSYVL